MRTEVALPVRGGTPKNRQSEEGDSEPLVRVHNASWVPTNWGHIRAWNLEEP